MLKIIQWLITGRGAPEHLPGPGLQAQRRLDYVSKKAWQGRVKLHSMLVKQRCLEITRMPASCFLSTR